MRFSDRKLRRMDARGLRRALATTVTAAIAACGAGKAGSGMESEGPVGDAGPSMPSVTPTPVPPEQPSPATPMPSEGVVCHELGAVRPCYEGDIASAGVGQCLIGQQACEHNGEFALWGACIGSRAPRSETCGDETDEDCDGNVDESCQSCAPGSTRECGDIEAAHIGVGICRQGAQVCHEDGSGYGECVGAVEPATEECDGLQDEDCDGMVDEGCMPDPVDPPPGPVDPPAIPDECIADSTPAPVPTGLGICTVALNLVDSISLSSSGCYVDEQLGSGGVLTYPCAGGEAHLVFGDHHFTGQVSADGNVELCLGTSFPFSDGCTWISAQQVYGNVAHPTLSWAYTEMPAAGFTGCYSACSATATLSM